MNVLCLLCLLWPAQADVLKLEECYRMAENHHPAATELKLYDSIHVRNVENIESAWLPQVELQARAAYQNETAEVPVALPGLALPELPNDNYSIGMELRQLLYDGGSSAAHRKLAATDLALQKQNTRVTLYGLREKVNDAFFAVLILQEHERSLHLLLEHVQNTLRQSRKLAQGGMISDEALHTLAAESARIEQSILGIRSKRQAALEILAELTGTPIAPQITLVPPDTAGLGSTSVGIERPELEAFALGARQLEQHAAIVESRTMPMVSAFAGGWYGRPGYNFFETKLRPYGIVGIQASWRFWDWNSGKREREILSLRSSILRSRAEGFAQSVRMAARNDANNIQHLEAALELDELIITHRRAVAREYTRRFEEGAATATEYLNELNAEQRALLDRRIHELELLRARINFATIYGGL